jgi:OHCU decarboxylase
MVALRPIANVFALSEEADRVWSTMQEADWLEAFACHPRIGERKGIGERKASMHAGAQSAAWSRAEQAQANSASDRVLAEIASGNRRYEELFGFTYIVCATGKSAEEMLAILKRRLESTRETELREAAEQQRQIMQIRLGKWLIE